MIENIKNALVSIWSNKVRSLLTVLGVVIGVTSVTTLVSLGQGLKNDVAASIQGFGTNVITVISGKIDTTTTGGPANNNPANFISGDILTEADMTALETSEGVKTVAPITLVTGTIKYNDQTATPAIYGTYPNFTDTIGILSIDKGSNFKSRASGNEIILAHNTTSALFDDTNPIGKTVTVGKEDFKIVGTFAKSKTVGLFGSEFDNISVIPFETAKRLNDNQAKIVRIIVKAADEADVATVKEEVKNTLLDNHEGEEDFTVLTQDDLLDLFNTFLTLATTMVSAIAAISLVVGGIGIMNIMLVTVTERTREIGLRKAVGATKTAILIQFLTEAIMVTFVGALLGLIISFTVGMIISRTTELQPAITPAVLLIAVGISVVIGIIFGLWPALRAANKDPIQALRYE